MRNTKVGSYSIMSNSKMSKESTNNSKMSKEMDLKIYIKPVTQRFVATQKRVTQNTEATQKRVTHNMEALKCMKILTE